MTDEEDRERTRGRADGRDVARDGGPSVVPEGADAEEAAAIVAALSTHLRETAEAEADDGSPDWRGRRWAFAGRSAALGGRAVRVPTDAPADDWTALGRADRL